jgi:hypothetical protein
MTQHYRTALVTGASSGIGAELARALAARGADLVLVARRADRLEALAAELTSVSVEVLTADLATDDGVDRVVARLAAAPVELLVNNAGVSTTGAFQDSDPSAEDSQVRVNVLALHRLTRAAVGPMVAAGHGGILNVSSIAGEQPLRNIATYAAGKAFVTHFTECLAADLRGTGVHVTVLKPGYVATEMNPAAPDPSTFAGRFWLKAPAVANAALDAVENGRLVSVPGPHWRVASELIQALPHQLIRRLTSRVSG